MVWWAQEVCPGPRKSLEGQREGPSRAEGGYQGSGPSMSLNAVWPWHVVALSELYFLI